jgi:hypothetical protein
MSFDLHFCWRQASKIDFQDVRAWAARIEGFDARDAQLWYSNPSTGVYFSFDFEAQSPESPDDGPFIPSGYFNSGLSFNLNYNRPSYFAFEAMPVVADVTSRFGLSVLNPQAGEAESPSPADCESLVRSWVQHNQRAVRAMMEQPNAAAPLTMPLAASTYLWRYAKSQKDFQRVCGDSVFVPSLIPVHKKDETLAARAIVYTHDLPTIIPECEWVFFAKLASGLFRLKKKPPEISIISADTFRELISAFVRPYDCQDFGLQIIAPEFAEKAGRAIRSVDRALPQSEFKMIAKDAFVDVDLSEPPA